MKITYLPSLLIIFPMVMIKKRPAGRLFFFFDRYSLGGAQRVHLDILKSVESVPKWVFFTRKSPDDTFKTEFEQAKNTFVQDISRYCDLFIYRIFSVHYYAFLINQDPDVKVMGSNSTFFYDLLPFLHKDITTIELLHNFTYGKNGMEFFGLQNYSRLRWRLVIDDATKKNILAQYTEYGIPAEFNERVKTIEFGVDIPSHIPHKSNSLLHVFYAGRGGPQKRIGLLNSIALHFIREKKPVRFYFAGTINGELSAEVKQHSVCYGPVSKKTDMENILSEGNILLMTSAYEGFPVLIKEAMAHGCVPVVTALPGILTHLKEGDNALLIHSFRDDAKVVEEGIEQINRLLEDNLLLNSISRAAYAYAAKHFGKQNFYQQYADLLR